MNKAFFTTLLAAATLLLGLGCAPSLPDTLLVTVGGDGTSRPIPGNFYRVSIGEFVDTRSDTSVAVIGGRKVQSEGNPSAVVQGALTERFRTSGLPIVLFDGERIVKGEIVEWSTKVTPQFPMTFVEAKAKLLVVVGDQEGKPLFKGYFSGTSHYEHPFLQSEGVEQVLGEAMRGAVDEVLKSSKLISVLRK